MVTKESDYLIELAEKQLRRLNESLYNFEQNIEYEDRLLTSPSLGFESNIYSGSLSLNNIHNLSHEKSYDYKVCYPEKRKQSMFTQKSSVLQRNSNFSNNKYLNSQNQSYQNLRRIKPNVSNNVRDWRNGLNLVKKTLGPHTNSSQSCLKNKNQNSDCGPRKERLSTFWDYDGRKKTIIARPIRRSENNKLNRSDSIALNTEEKNYKNSKKSNRSRSEIRKYMRERQQQYQQQKKPKQNIKMKQFGHTRITETGFVDLSKENQMNSKSTGFKKTVFDELCLDGFKFYRGEKQKMSTNYSRPRANGLKSTNDSGIETGEMARSCSPEYPGVVKNLKKSSKVVENHNSNYSAQLQRLNKMAKSENPKMKSKYYDLLDKVYREMITAYDNEDGSSEYDDQSAIDKISSSSIEETIREISHKSPTCHVPSDSTGDITLPKTTKSTDFTQKDTLNSQDDVFIKSSLAEELKKALLEARLQLNLTSDESLDHLTVKISNAVQRFIETKTRLSATTESLEKELLSKDEKIGETPPVETTHSNSKKVVPDSISTELEVTELAYEESKIRPKKEEISQDIIEEQTEMEYSNLPSSVTEKKEVSNSDYHEVNLKNKINKQEKALQLITLKKQYLTEKKKVKILEDKYFKKTPQLFNNSEEEGKKNKPISSIGTEEYNSTYENDPLPTKLNCQPDLVINQGDNKVQNDVRSTKPANDSYPVNSDTEETISSVSNVTTSLTNQSELEAQIVALKSELDRKKHLVDTLKMRQKKLKRDWIKNKENTLHKQIEMCDDQINILEKNIEKLEDQKSALDTPRGHDEIEDAGSDTLTGSLTNVNGVSKINNTILGENTDHQEPDCNYSQQPEEKQVDILEKGDVLNNNGARANSDLIAESEEIESTVKSAERDLFVNQNMRERRGTLDDAELESLGSQEDIFNKDFDTVTELEGDADVVAVAETEAAVTSSVDTKVTKHDKWDQVEESNDSHFETAAKTSTAAATAFRTATRSEESVEEDSLEVIKKTGDECVPSVDDVAADNNTLNNSSSSNSSNKNNRLLANAPEVLKNATVEQKELDEYDLEDNIETEDAFIVALDSDGCNDVENDDEFNKKVVCKEEGGENKQISQSGDDIVVNKIVQYLVGQLVTQEASRLTADVLSNLTPDSNTNLRVDSHIHQQSTSFMNSDGIVKTPIVTEEINTHISETQSVSDGIWKIDENENNDSVININSNAVDKDNVVDDDDDDDDDDGIQLDDDWNSVGVQLQSDTAVSTTITTNTMPLNKNVIQWIVPFEFDKIQPLVEIAFGHFYRSLYSKSISSVVTDDSFSLANCRQTAISEAAITLPDEFETVECSVTESDLLLSRYDKAGRKGVIDKRILFYLVYEIFKEIYSVNRTVPDKPWIHSSVMTRKKNYTLWLDEKPPEKMDLVKKIVTDRVYELLKPFVELPEKVEQETKRSLFNPESQSKIIKWCMTKQKDEVDRILLNDMRQEESDWVFYDDSEEEVKVQVANEIFNVLLEDTVCWIRNV